MPAAVFFTVLDRVDSTNNYAMEQVHAGLARHGMAWFAREQVAGKGQRGRGWDSEPGKNIALSLILQPELIKITQGFFLSAAVALACNDLFSKYAGDETSIKWPNDLYWRDRKAGGILIENVQQGSAWKYAIIGVGININQTIFNAALKNPVSLKQITGRDHDAIKLGEELYELLMARVANMGTGSFEETRKIYNHHLFGLNKPVRLKKDNIVFETIVKEVNAQGQLVTVDAIERCFDFGKVEWIV
jgi:BirA family biotin operon repressor/biotin-[acetyl-CoA-carboxylase] ligase